MKLLFLISLLVSASGAIFAEDTVEPSRQSFYNADIQNKCPIQIVPGGSFGKLALGMNRSEFNARVLHVKIVEPENERSVGMYSVQFDDQDRLNYIQAELSDLPDCIYFGKRKISKTLTPQDLAQVFEACVQAEPRKGGSLITCKGLDIISGGWGGHQKTPALRVLHNKP